jgi:hypothetical protein
MRYFPLLLKKPKKQNSEMKRGTGIDLCPAGMSAASADAAGTT